MRLPADIAAVIERRSDASLDMICAVLGPLLNEPFLSVMTRHLLRAICDCALGRKAFRFFADGGRWDRLRKGESECH